PRFASVIFLVFILVGIADLTSAATGLLNNLLSRPHSTLDFLHLFPLNLSTLTLLLFSFAVLFAFGLFMACFVNVNTFSLHGAYRDRLVRAYLGASKLERHADAFTGFDDSDNFQLHRLRGQRPFHVINATLNLVDGANLAWQNRKAASFTMSPLHCGSWVLDYRDTFAYSRNLKVGVCKELRYCNRPDGTCEDNTLLKCRLSGKSLRLGTAMAISGAAANPNMGYYSSPVVMFLMAMFNIRLGWWLGNTGKSGNQRAWFGLGRQYFTKPSPTIAILPLISETLGRTDEEKHFVNVSDGGHFENLGLYEMVVRRCKFIVLSDAAADHRFAFDDLSNAIEKCKVDLGVDIKFIQPVDIHGPVKNRRKEEPSQRFAVAKITYPELADAGDPTADNEGILFYIKPTICGNEPIELRHYVQANPTFPHQSTADQLFDEKQFEAYRSLGFLTMNEILDGVPTNDLESMFKFIVASQARSGKDSDGGKK
ncbi:MAG TPA: hypothetical protein VEV84_07025, partial [Pyrinomonadaceae bacterium]|nr:hypothetical protein [Pyrinomonadaceae bacterium]